MKIRFDATLSCDESRGGYRILYPVADGFIEYTFVHSVVPEKNCDIWRMSVVSVLNEKGESLRRLTKAHAEWEMAVRLLDRPDFIGGYNHGDEIGKAPRLMLDGVSVSEKELSDFREFSKLEIVMESVGYDPASPADAVLSHCKRYLFDEEGVHLSQEVTWLRDVVLDGKLNSYLAMMPPMKHEPSAPEKILTDSFSFGEDQVQGMATLPVRRKGVKKITVEGTESGYRFVMSVGEYEPLYPNSYLALLTDNGNLNYHKMYIAFAGGEKEAVAEGEIWRASTHYRIEKN